MFFTQFLPVTQEVTFSVFQWLSLYFFLFFPKAVSYMLLLNHVRRYPREFTLKDAARAL